MLRRDSSVLTWKMIGFIILSIRFVQGWIYWGGGSRRFIYAPSKLDPYATQWMANKLQSAMPGALLDLSHAISFLLQHFYLLYAAIIVFSLVELFSGLALIFGCFTRLAGFITAMLSISLMLIFGWEGSTCLDEWTMAVANLSIGLTLALSGSSMYSVDSWLLHRYPKLAERNWFLLLASGPLEFQRLKNLGIIFLIFTMIFTLSTYDYFRGAIFSRYHAGPVSPVEHHLTLSKGRIFANGELSFFMYADAGTTAAPDYIIRIELLNEKKEIIESWDGKELSQLPVSAIKNTYLYNQIKSGPHGIIAPVSAKAEIILPTENAHLNLQQGTYLLQVYTVDGRRWDLTFTDKLKQGRFMTTENYLIKQNSSLSVNDIMNHLEKILRDKNVKIFARISHSQAAKEAGLTMPDEEVLVFGNPKVGTALMLENPAIGIELPLKIIAWREQGHTVVAYQNLDKLGEIFTINSEKNTLTTLKNFMQNLVAEVIK